MDRAQQVVGKFHHDRTATSPESWVVMVRIRGSHPQAAQHFRVVNYIGLPYLPRYMDGMGSTECSHLIPPMSKVKGWRAACVASGILGVP